MSLELLVWLIVSAAGMLTAAGSLRFATLIMRAVRRRKANPELVDGNRHLWQTQLELLIGWSLFFVVGVLGSLQPASAQTAEPTKISELIVWLLIASVALWSFMTVSDYLYTRRRLSRLRTD